MHINAMLGYTSTLGALVGILSVRQRLGKETTSQLLLHVPFGGTLRLPGPVYPASLHLEGVQLRLDEATDVVFVGT